MELKAHGFELYYFKGKKQGEIDFIIELNGEIHPIEIKSGKDYKRHSALRNVLEISNYGIKNATVFCNDNLKVEGKIQYLPIYMLMFLNNNKVELGTYKVDLDGLL